MARNAFLTVATAIALLSGQAMAAAGAFLLASGDVQVRDVAGTLRAAKTGMEINSGETILTQSGRAQVRFTDAGQISLQPGTEFKIADYRFHKNGKQDESAVFSLIRGGVRAITGVVGRRSKVDYVMNTVVATIGIRGTEFQAIFCKSSCKEPDGLYVHTGEGIVFVKNALGEIDVGRGQTAFVASPDTAPRRTSGGPSMSSVPQITQPPVLSNVTQPGFQPGTIITHDPFGSLTVLSGGGVALTGSGTFTFEGTTYSGVGGAGSGSATNTSTGIIGVYINGSNVNGMKVSQDGNFASIQFDTVLNGTNNGDLYWGRWSGGNVSFASLGVGGGFPSGTVAIPASVSLHYILGTSVPTIPTSGSASFSFVGGTPSTDAGGNVGSGITGGTVHANFLSNMVGANFTVVHGSTLNVSATMPMGLNHRSEFSSDRIGGYVSGATGTVAGFFVGTSSPTGAGLSYSLNNNIVGVGAFR
ncbi:MAG: FecR family protein [Sulfuritalea sp.]|jgi:hypothetical protein|nr:FecR family protein [Sulfuritalea sp.]